MKHSPIQNDLMRSDVLLLYQYPRKTTRQKIAFTLYRWLVRMDERKRTGKQIPTLDLSKQTYIGKQTFFWYSPHDFQATGAFIRCGYRLLVEKANANADWKVSISRMNKFRFWGLKRLFNSTQPKQL